MDAAKHMWPADIEALQAKLKDVYSGGRPYFYMEVIDLCKYYENSSESYLQNVVCKNENCNLEKCTVL